MSYDMIERVRMVAPAVETTSELERARQRRKLDLAIVSESAVPEGPTPLWLRLTPRSGGWHVSRWRLLLAGVAAAVVAAAGTAIPLSLSARPPATTHVAKSAEPVMRLASYRLRLPRNYHLTAAVTSDCHPYIAFRPPTGTPGIMPETPSYAPQVASAAGAAGGCVFMALLPTYTPTQANPDPEKLTLQDTEQVQVGPYQAWVGTSSFVQTPADGKPIIETMLYVEIPASDGQTQDLVVGGYGLSQTDLVALVVMGLSVDGAFTTPGTATPITGSPSAGQTPGTSGTAGNTGTTTNSGANSVSYEVGNSGSSSS
jgi:hypothetical protein